MEHFSVENRKQIDPNYPEKLWPASTPAKTILIAVQSHISCKFCTTPMSNSLPTSVQQLTFILHIILALSSLKPLDNDG